MSQEGKTDGPPFPASGSSLPGPIVLEEFQRVTLRTGVITSAEDHPQADRLLVLKIDLGAGDTRQIVAGIKGSYHLAELVGKQVVVVTNLRPVILRGVESQGMILAASDETTVVLVSPERPIRAGSLVK